MSALYTVGPPVKGDDFYGREEIIGEILSSHHSLYVLGMRRIGKTSLLYRLEALGPALFLNLQKVAGSLKRLARQVQRQIQDKGRELPWLPPVGEGKDPFELLEDVDERAAAAGMKMLLLCDEAEGLLDIERRQPDTLKILRGLIQGCRALRTILMATKNLTKVDDLCRSWDTSPFLSIFPPPLYLAGLSDEEAASLICQSQSPKPVQVSSDLMVKINRLTNNHPYLIQYLCSCLYSDGRLRPIGEGDLILRDEHLVRGLRQDFDYLSDGEQCILHRVCALERSTMTQLQETIPLADLPIFLHGLTQLGYLRQEGEYYTIGNHFLATWLRQHAVWGQRSEVSNEGTIEIYRRSTMPTTDPVTAWALSVLGAATTFLFTQASELLKERREKRQAERAEKPISPPPGETKAAPAPIFDADSLLAALEQKADLAARRADVENVESLMSQLDEHRKNVNYFREKLARGLGLHEELDAKKSLAEQQEEIARKSEEMRAILERLSG
ncbi:MAG: hypothetical protein ACETWB_00285, partial [Anaerolineae bacterium]